MCHKSFFPLFLQGSMTIPTHICQVCFENSHILLLSIVNCYPFFQTWLFKLLTSPLALLHSTKPHCHQFSSLEFYNLFSVLLWYALLLSGCWSNHSRCTKQPSSGNLTSICNDSLQMESSISLCMSSSFIPFPLPPTSIRNWPLGLLFSIAEMCFSMEILWFNREA